MRLSPPHSHYWHVPIIVVVILVIVREIQKVSGMYLL